MIALSRTCALADFAGCLTVADWQQRLAAAAWLQWLDEHHIRSREQSLCVNWSGCEFVAPGPSAIYQYPTTSSNGIERQVPAVYGLSVLDHTEAPLRFVNRAAQLLKPNGLLFLTFSFWDAEGEDTAAGHEHRVRIYDVHSWKKLVGEARRLGFANFGGHDWNYHGHALDDHSLASLVLVRR